jgi:hypothetical protein
MSRKQMPKLVLPPDVAAMNLVAFAGMPKRKLEPQRPWDIDTETWARAKAMVSIEFANARCEELDRQWSRKHDQ